MSKKEIRARLIDLVVATDNRPRDAAAGTVDRWLAGYGIHESWEQEEHGAEIIRLVREGRQ